MTVQGKRRQLLVDTAYIVHLYSWWNVSLASNFFPTRHEPSELRQKLLLVYDEK